MLKTIQRYKTDKMIKWCAFDEWSTYFYELIFIHVRHNLFRHKEIAYFPCEYPSSAELNPPNGLFLEQLHIQKNITPEKQNWSYFTEIKPQS